MSLSIKYQLPDNEPIVISLTAGRVLIGTLLSNEIVLKAPGIEPIHAMIETNDSGTSVLIDLGSATGIKKNSQKVDVETALTKGDKLLIGNFTLSVVEEEDAVADETVPVPMVPGYAGTEEEDDAGYDSDDDGRVVSVPDSSGPRSMTERRPSPNDKRTKKERLFSPRKAKPSGNVLEVVSYWDDTVLDVELFHPSYKGFDKVTIGDPTKAHLFGGGKKYFDQHVLATFSGEGYRLRLMPDMKTRIRKEGEVMEKEGESKINLGRRDIAHIAHGAIKYFLMFVTPPPLDLPPNRARDPIFAGLLSVSMLLYFLAMPVIWTAERKDKEEKEDDIWALVNAPEKEKIEKKEPIKPPPPPKPEQKVVEKKEPPKPKPIPPPPPPKPVQAAKPVEKEKPQQVKPVEKPAEKPNPVAALDNKPKQTQPVEQPKPELSKLRDVGKTGMATTGANKPDFKLAGEKTNNNSLVTGGAKGSGMNQAGGARKGKQANSVMGVEGVNNNKASGVNLSKLGLGAGKILNKTGPGAIKTNFVNSAGGAGGGSGSASKTYGLGGVGAGQSLGLAGSGSAVNNFGSGAGGDGSGQGGTGGLGGVGLGRGFGTKGDGGDGRGRANVVVPPGDPVVSGGLTSQEVSAVIRANLNQIRHCYEQLLQRSPSASGKIKVRFTIDPSGRVSSTGIESSTISDSVMTGCVTGKVVRWKFPEPRGGQAVTVTYPFVFNPL
ncbi:MAG: AgmX/PglI C-terminal domain-containing protein [Oligoflexales bacterium]